MTEITNNITSLNTGLNNVVGNLSQAKTDIRKIPVNADADGNADIKYLNKINDPYAASPSSTVASGFNTILGSSNNGGIVGTFYGSITAVYDTLSGIQSSSGSFTSGSASFNSSVGSITADLANVQTQINDLDASVKSGLEIMDTPKDIGNLVINLIYGIALGIAVLALLGVILMTFCDKYKCRYLMYFSCVILFFFGLLGFIIAILFSIVVPVMYFFCEWLDVTITSTGFNTNTQKFISDTQVQTIISSCLVGGTGDIMSAVGGASIGTTINGLRDSIKNTNSFNTSSQSAEIDTAIANITATITGFRDGVIPDLSDSDSITALTAITRMQDFSGCPSSPADSWVPSMANTSLIGCSISASTVNPSSCSV